MKSEEIHVMLEKVKTANINELKKMLKELARASWVTQASRLKRAREGVRSDGDQGKGRSEIS